jgi:hypothetical protein
MAILDAQLMFCEALAMPNGASAASTNVIDLSLAGKVFASNQMKMFMIWTGVPVGTSLKIDLRSGATASYLTSTPSWHWSTGIIPQASYASQGIGVASSITIVHLPYGSYNPTLAAGTGATGAYKRYLGLYITAVGDATAGLLTAGLVSDIDLREYPASAFSV